MVKMDEETFAEVERIVLGVLAGSCPMDYGDDPSTSRVRDYTLLLGLFYTVTAAFHGVASARGIGVRPEVMEWSEAFELLDRILWPISEALPSDPDVNVKPLLLFGDPVRLGGTVALLKAWAIWYKWIKYAIPITWERAPRVLRTANYESGDSDAGT